MRKDIELYLKGVNDSSTSILLEGPKGLSQEQDAIELAAALLNTEPSRLQIHPDYLIYHVEKQNPLVWNLRKKSYRKQAIFLQKQHIL